MNSLKQKVLQLVDDFNSDSKSKSAKAEKAMIEWAGTYVSKTTGGGVRERKVLATDLLNYFKKYIRGE